MNSAPNEFKLWTLSFGYSSLADAGPAYEAARDIIFNADGDVDAGVYRARVNGACVVIIIGIGELTEELRNRFVRDCHPRWLAAIPGELFITLLLRHVEQRSLGARVERRAGEPPRIDPF